MSSMVTTKSINQKKIVFKQTFMKKFLLLSLLFSAFYFTAFPQCGTTNLALNKPTTVSSTNPNGGGSDHLGPKAVDGSIGTSWWSGENPNQWIYVDLQQTYNVCQVVIKWDNDYRASDFTIEISSDATNWTNLKTITDNSAATNTEAVSGSGRYIRINMTEIAVFWAANYSLAELEVYNSSNNNLPTVNITDPTNNANFTAGSNITINATAADSDGSITKVEFFRGTTLLGEDVTAPYSYTWSNAAAGSYALTAKATDNAGGTTTSSTVNITVNSNQAPSVSISNPANNSMFAAGGNITVNATASDADGSISKVEFYQGTTLLGEDLTAPYSYTWNGVAAGTYSLTAKATDNSNAATTSSAVSITSSGSWSLTGMPGTTAGTHFFGTTDNNDVVFKTNNTERFRVTANGNIGIGTIAPTVKLAVNGDIFSKKVKVTQSGWPDYVFDNKYQLPSLAFIEKYIKEHQHLPDVPSAKEVEEHGLNLGDNQAILLRKIEEITLYLITQNKKLDEQQKMILQQQQTIEQLKKSVKQLKHKK